MQCKELEFVLAHEDLGVLSVEAREHLADCNACRDLFSDFSAIVTAAKHIPAEANPPERVWVAVRAQLEAEGIIREPEALEPVTTESSWWSGLGQFFRPRVLATVAGALLMASGAVYFAQHQRGVTNNPTQVADTSKPTTMDTAKAVEPVAAPAPVADLKPRDSRNHSGRAGAPAQPHESHLDLRPSPSENANFSDAAMVLSDTEGALPSRSKADNAMVDAALRQNLRTLNEFIAECETRLKQNPQDQLTREYLNMAYQQKAELLSAMMDSGRSEN
jgi:hypothetical protein